MSYDYREPLEKLKNLIEERVGAEELSNAIFVEKVVFSIFDGRSCGVDNQAFFSGVYCEDGKVRMFTFSDIDVSEEGKGFIENILARFGKENCYFSPNARVELNDNEIDCSLNVAAESLYAIAKQWTFLETLNKSFYSYEKGAFLYEKIKKILKGTGIQHVFELCKSLEQFEILKSQGVKKGYNPIVSCKGIYRKLQSFESHFSIDIGEYDFDSLLNEPVWPIIKKLQEFGIDNFDEYVEE